MRGGDETLLARADTCGRRVAARLSGSGARKTLTPAHLSPPRLHTHSPGSSLHTQGHAPAGRMVKEVYIQAPPSHRGGAADR